MFLHVQVYLYSLATWHRHVTSTSVYPVPLKLSPLLQLIDDFGYHLAQEDNSVPKRTLGLCPVQS